MSSDKRIALSLVIPCFNEAENLRRLFNRCREAFGNRSDIQVIIVDNGSSDSTEEILAELVDKNELFTAVKVDVNVGYGHGILSGLAVGKGQVLAWTHADLQTDPADAIRGLEYFKKSENSRNIFVKGQRVSRPLFDLFFTTGMSLFEMITLGTLMWDINAQPTMFHRSFYEKLRDAPNDFALDLFVFYTAKMLGLSVERFPVQFPKRKFGEAHLNNIRSKFLYSYRTIKYSSQIKKRRHN